MLEQRSTHTADGRGRVTATYDLVVVGAGIAGLNALFAATQYLPKRARVLLIDQKSAAGGMWHTAYDYVRLHQPHRMFTVGDVGWDWDKPYAYLARRDEVRDHLAKSLGRIAEFVDLETRFGHTVIACDEVRTDGGYRAKVICHPNHLPHQTMILQARRAIHAVGFNYREADSLPLSSNQVISIIPQDLRATLAANPDAPVYVVGGGKTGMDTVLATLAEGSGRKISLLNGQGTNFLNRTKYLPTRLKRWTSGKPISRVFRDLALNFDGDNEEHTISHLRRRYSTDPHSQNGVFLYGWQSEDEQVRIAGGLSRTYADYLVDVVDFATGPNMQLRSGLKEPVERGSIFVNCSGSFFRTSGMAEQLRCISPHDTVARLNVRDGFHFLTSVAGLFMTHLLYRGDLRGRGFYTIDYEALFRKNRNALFGATVAQAYMNQVIAVQTLPMTVLDRVKLDLDRWYPLPRRAVGLTLMKASAKRDIAHCRSALDRVADRFGVHCAPLEQGR